ncbi:MAG: ABC transporter substrate-binding protein, partial [Candidatus Thermoplasmatota archaeon]|nr:ABC transporter substrate-binding protein [Candidatus Thermoplasmatota archaeon]
MAPRIVSLAPSNTELVAFLGLADHLVGVDDWSDWPPSVLHLPQVGPDLQIDMDAVVELDPDLVLASLSVPGMEPVVEALAATGLDHLVLA